MRRALLLLAALGFAVPLVQAQTNPLYVSPDVPTVPGGAATLLSCTGGPAMLPWEIYRYNPTAAVTYTCALSVPGSPHVDAIHKMDTVGDFLLSVEEPSNLGGVLLPAGSTAMPGDVIHYDASAGTYTLCFVGSSVGIPAESNVDALYRSGGDTGSLVVSFDVPTTLGAFPTFEPADLVSLIPSAAVVCPPAWALAAANPTFDASTAGAGIPISRNLIGADELGAAFLLSLDVPTDVSPPAQPTRVPGQMVTFSAGSYALFESLLAWPISSQVDGLSCLPTPGVVPTTIAVNKTVSPGQLDLTPITVTWSASPCTEGAANYGIYEGTLGTWYSHTSLDCDDAGSNLTETVTPTAGNKYYIVVAHNGCKEGSYGTCSPVAACGAGNERPVGVPAVCASPRVLSPCPP